MEHEDLIPQEGDEVIAVDPIRHGEVVYFLRRKHVVEIHSARTHAPAPGTQLFRAERGAASDSMTFAAIGAGREPASLSNLTGRWSWRPGWPCCRPAVGLP